MSYVIPENPRSVATQLKRERLLAQEAKYEKGAKNQEDEDFMSVIREASIDGGRPGPARHGWTRRFSKLSDGLDAHVDIGPVIGPLRHHNSKHHVDGSTVWQVT